MNSLVVLLLLALFHPITFVHARNPLSKSTSFFTRNANSLASLTGNQMGGRLVAVNGDAATALVPMVDFSLLAPGPSSLRTSKVFSKFQKISFLFSSGIESDHSEDDTAESLRSWSFKPANERYSNFSAKKLAAVQEEKKSNAKPLRSPRLNTQSQFTFHPFRPTFWSNLFAGTSSSLNSPRVAPGSAGGFGGFGSRQRGSELLDETD
ncbi:hypothetical protein HDV05_000722 [Chytridiales sp. JEL 0842]|nr:hypothetical protein HDV05_000722 [Chytridiales sp. JEL 0842]